LRFCDDEAGFSCYSSLTSLLSSHLYSHVRSVRLLASVAELHHFYAAPAPGKNFDAAPAAPAPAPTLLNSKAKNL
jgi:hypothetical protein